MWELLSRTDEDSWEHQGGRSRVSINRSQRYTTANSNLFSTRRDVFRFIYWSNVYIGIGIGMEQWKKKLFIHLLREPFHIQLCREKDLTDFQWRIISLSLKTNSSTKSFNALIINYQVKPKKTRAFWTINKSTLFFNWRIRNNK